jgi:hypothetical protein
MTLEEHARAIEAALQAAADDGFYLDNTDGFVPELDLNDWEQARVLSVRVDVPQN